MKRYIILVLYVRLRVITYYIVRGHDRPIYQFFIYTRRTIHNIAPPVVMPPLVIWVSTYMVVVIIIV